MKQIFENIIKRGGYDLTRLLKKIDSYHIEGKLTDAERDELYAQARQTPEAQYEVKAEIEKHGLKLLGVLPQNESVYRCDCDGEPSAKLPASNPVKVALKGIMANLGL